MTHANYAPPDELDVFIRTAKGRDVPDDALVTLLRQNGWSERRVYRRLTDYYRDVLGVAPPMRSSGAEYANEAFLYLLNFITLGFWIVALGQIFVAMIARTFPDAAHPLYQSSLLYDVSWQLATIIIAFPCFLVVARQIGRALRRRPDAADSGVRSWLTYIALVIAGVIAIADSIWFVGGFLRGELTTQFVLNTLVVVGLSSGVFGYYLTTLRPRSIER